MVNAQQGLVVILGTGGTIAGSGNRPGENLGYTAGQVSVESLVEQMPGQVDAALEMEQVAQIDSKNMRFAVWQNLVARLAHHLARPEVTGVVITHGTDTLEETGYLLHELFDGAKPVVLTCAMRPATAPFPDGPQNLADAIKLASTPGAHGLMAVCAGRVHAAQSFSKVHTYRLDPFDSGEHGLVGYVEEGRVRLQQGWPGSRPADVVGYQRDAFLAATHWPRVEIVMNHGDADGALVDALMAQGRSTKALAVSGIVVAGTGNGTASDGLSAALERAESDGVRVMRASRCAEGAVLPTSLDRFPSAGTLSPVKARLALALALSHGTR